MATLGGRIGHRLLLAGAAAFGATLLRTTRSEPQQRRYSASRTCPTNPGGDADTGDLLAGGRIDA